MMIRFLLAVAVLVALFWLFRRWRALPPEKRNNRLLQALVYGALILCVLAVITGRLHWLGAVLAGVVALAKIGFTTALRFLPFVNVLRRNSLLNNPVFKTQFLKVQLDLKTGQISGIVLKGPHEGEDISQLNKEQLKALEQHYQERDKPSCYLIRVILQRAGKTYHEDSKHGNFSSVAAPSVDEALQILGLEKNPSKEAVVKAHRSLMQKLHPDRGGNDYLASRVNLAKEILIKHLEKSDDGR